MSRFLQTFAMLGIAAVGFAQAPSDPLIKQDFKDSQGGWTTFGPSATVMLSHDAPAVAPGEGALKFGYTVKKGDISALVFPVQVGTLTRAKSLKFRVRADDRTVMAVMLQKDNGSRYVAVCMAPKDSWQPIELSIDDFSLSDGPGDPKDPAGKLEMDKVNGIVVTDLAQLFAQSDDETTKTLLAVQPGSHSLFLDGFSVSPDALPTVVSKTGSDIRLDTFRHPQLSWFPLGGGDLTRATNAPTPGVSLKYSYHQTLNKFELVAHSVTPGMLDGARTVSIDLASDQPARLMLQIEQTDGGKYNTPIDMDGGPMSKHFVLSFANFKPSDDSSIKSGMPDMSKVKTIIVIDLSGALAQADHDNVLWIGAMVAHT